MLLNGGAEGLNQLSNALFEKATQGNVTAVIYYLKVRDRENWGENQPESLREIPPLQIIVDSMAVKGQFMGVLKGGNKGYRPP